MELNSDADAFTRTRRWAEIDDETLLARSATDPEAFRELYRRHSDGVHRYFVSRTGRRQVALDLTAETFAALYTTRRRFRGDLGNVAQWLFGIARTELARYRRSQSIEARAAQRLRVAVPLVEPDDELVERVAERLDAKLHSEGLRTALDRLTPAERNVIELRVLHNLSTQEVAKRLGCTNGAARVRAHRALRRLRRLMEDPQR